MSKPAIIGGSPALRVPLPPWPQHDELEVRLLLQTLESGTWWSATGTRVKALEAAFAAHHGAPFGIAVTNGTHALELALRTLEVDRGDEVIVPSLTYVATSMAVFAVGARPVPVDVLPDTWCMDPAAVRAALSERTRAIIPVHFAGHIAAMDQLLSLAEDHGIPIIEDAAHAHGARWGGRAAGSFGCLAAFSFQNFKLMTAGEGGMLLAANERLRDRALLLQNCGRPAGDTTYRHVVTGSNYRMSEFQAAVLSAQLTRLQAQGARREHTAAQLDRELGTLAGIHPQRREPHLERHARYMYVFTMDPEAFAGMDRDVFVAALNAEGIPAFRMYPRVQDTGHFAEAARLAGGPEHTPEAPVSRNLAEHGVWIHHRLLLGDAALAGQTVEAIARIREHAAAIHAGHRGTSI